MTTEALDDLEMTRPSELLLGLVEVGYIRNDLAAFVVQRMVEKAEPWVVDSEGNARTRKIAEHGAIVASHLSYLRDTGSRMLVAPTFDIMNNWAEEYIASDVEPEIAEYLAMQTVRMPNRSGAYLTSGERG